MTNSYTKNRGFNINGSTYLKILCLSRGLQLLLVFLIVEISTSSYGVGQSYSIIDKAKRDLGGGSRRRIIAQLIQWENF